MINLTGTRVDVSSLDAGDEIIATISTTAPTGLIPISQSRRGTVSAAVAVVKAGLVVEIDAASRLICNLDATYESTMATPCHRTALAEIAIPVGGVPMITVSEGFDDAWEARQMLSAAPPSPSRPSICLKEWSCGGRRLLLEFMAIDPDDDQPPTPFGPPSPCREMPLKSWIAGRRTEDATDGSMVTYDYSIAMRTEQNGCDGFLRNPHNGRHRRHCFGSRRHRRYLGYPQSGAC